MKHNLVMRRFQMKSLMNWMVAAILSVAGVLCAFQAQGQPVPMKVADAAVSAAKCPDLLNRHFNKLQDESDQSLCQYSGKVILIVNTASYCGFTSQYEGLEKLYAKYADKGLVVLGFPSNDFSQEPGSNKDIADFCYNTYGVKFPMFSKSSVVGKEANPLYVELAKQTGKKPGWNFYKYLIDRNGKPVASFGSIVSPTDSSFISEVERLLASK